MLNIGTWADLWNLDNCKFYHSIPLSTRGYIWCIFFDCQSLDQTDLKGRTGAKSQISIHAGHVDLTSRLLSRDTDSGLPLIFHVLNKTPPTQGRSLIRYDRIQVATSRSKNYRRFAAHDDGLYTECSF
jgi:hypothetical protein